MADIGQEAADHVVPEEKTKGLAEAQKTKGNAAFSKGAPAGPRLADISGAGR